MNRRFSLDQLRSLRRPETYLVVVLLVVLISLYFINGKANDAEDELSDAENALIATQDDLRFWNNNFDQLTLQDELTVLLDAPRPEALPTQAEALEFGTEFVDYASRERLPLNALEVTDITLILEDSEFPAVRYSILISGSLESLVRTLLLFDSFPTLSVQNMDFFRAEQGNDIWGLDITLDVVHQEEEA